MREIDTKIEKTWCPGCANFTIDAVFKTALMELEKEGLDLSKIVVLSGIGCHGKISDYLNLNSFYSLHGRAIPVAEGIKLANKDLIPIVFVGDGDVYGEGLEHLIFAAKRNTNINVFVHNNRVYGLTTGQFAPTSPEKFKGRSTPKGSVEEPINPIELMLASKSSFVARAYTGKPEHLKETIKQALHHRGFSFVDILMPCLVYFDNRDLYEKNVYEMQGQDVADFNSAIEKAFELDYNNGGKIPVGVFYNQKKLTFEEKIYENFRNFKK